jgi:hypothetical protein
VFKVAMRVVKNVVEFAKEEKAEARHEVLDGRHPSELDKLMPLADQDNADKELEEFYAYVIKELEEFRRNKQHIAAVSPAAAHHEQP